jgi:hypothetical protein
MATKTESSTKVFIRVKKQNSRIPDEVYLGTRRAIGATLTSSGVVNTGLTKAEEKKYLPKILGVEHSSVDWNKRINDYFSTLVIRVPFGEEVALNLAQDSEGDYENPLDYIKYKFALVNPEVAMSKEECRNGKVFYIYNPIESVNKEYNKLATKKDAFRELIKVTDKPEKIDAIMNVLGLETKGLSLKEKEIELEKQIETNPARFIEVSQDKDLELKAFIEECITCKVLDKVGSSIIDSDESIGNSMAEAVVFLKDKNNSGTLVKLKARLSEFKKSK